MVPAPTGRRERGLCTVQCWGGQLGDATVPTPQQTLRPPWVGTAVHLICQAGTLRPCVLAGGPRLSGMFPARQMRSGQGQGSGETQLSHSSSVPWSTRGHTGLRDSAGTCSGPRRWGQQSCHKHFQVPPRAPWATVEEAREVRLGRGLGMALGPLCPLPSLAV